MALHLFYCKNHTGNVFLPVVPSWFIFCIRGLHTPPTTLHFLYLATSLIIYCTHWVWSFCDNAREECLAPKSCRLWCLFRCTSVSHSGWTVNESAHTVPSEAGRKLVLNTVLSGILNWLSGFVAHLKHVDVCCRPLVNCSSDFKILKTFTNEIGIIIEITNHSL